MASPVVAAMEVRPAQPLCRGTPLTRSPPLQQGLLSLPEPLMEVLRGLGAMAESDPVRVALTPERPGPACTARRQVQRSRF